MKLEFKIEIEIPEADVLAEQVYEHIYLNDWYEEDDLETLSEEDIKGSLLSMDDDGQFTLGNFGMEF